MGIYQRDFQDYWELIHNLGYLVINLGEGGRKREAIQWATLLQNLTVNPDKPLLLEFSPVTNRAAARYFHQGLIALPLVHMQYSEWTLAALNLDHLIENVLPPVISGTSYSWLFEYYNALKQYSLAMANVEANYLQSAQTNFQNLQNLVANLSSTLNSEGDYGYAVGQRSYQSLLVNIQEVNGSLLVAQGELTAGITVLLGASIAERRIPYNEPPIYSRPVLSTLINVYFEHARKSSNESERDDYLQSALEFSDFIARTTTHYQSGFALHQKAQAFIGLGELDWAFSVYDSLLNKWWKKADQYLPIILTAKSFLQEHPTEPDNRNNTVIALAVWVGVFGFLTIALLFYIFIKNHLRRRSEYIRIEGRDQIVIR